MVGRAWSLTPADGGGVDSSDQIMLVGVGTSDLLPDRALDAILDSALDSALAMTAVAS
jgi:hypothetical protein